MSIGFLRQITIGLCFALFVNNDFVVMLWSFLYTKCCLFFARCIFLTVRGNLACYAALLDRILALDWQRFMHYHTMNAFELELWLEWLRKVSWWPSPGQRVDSAKRNTTQIKPLRGWKSQESRMSAGRVQAHVEHTDLRRWGAFQHLRPFAAKFLYMIFAIAW